MFLTLGCSHRYGISQAHAYTRTITAGTVPVDDQNRPQTTGVQTTYLLYLELEDTIGKPQWDRAWIKGAAYTIQPIKITGDSLVIGKTKGAQQTVSLLPKTGNSLWQLLLSPLPQITPSRELQKKIENHAVVLSGLWKGKGRV